MGDALDREELAVYEQILNLSPSECPPNHYALIGVSPEERDGKAIEVAARQRAEQLRRGVSADLLRAARVVLKKIQRAQTCLLDTQARASYDIAIGRKPVTEKSSGIWDELDPAEILKSNNVISSTKPVALRPSALHQQQALRVPVTTGRRQIAVSKKSVSRNNTAIYSIVGLSVTLLSIFVAYVLTRHSNQDAPKSSVADRKEEIASKSDASSLPPAKVVTQVDKAALNRESKTVESEKASPSPSAQHSVSTDLTSFQTRRPGDLRGEKGANPNRNSNADLATEPKVASADAPSTTIAPFAAYSLKAIPDAAELPAQRTNESTLPSNMEQGERAFVLGPAPAEGLSVVIDQPEVFTVKDIRFEVVGDPKQSTPPAWEVWLKSVAQETEGDEKSSLDDVSAGLNEVVARVYIEDGEIKFKWISSGHSQLVGQLRNCVLCLRHADVVHRIQLRPYQKIPPIDLDFEKSSLSLPVSGETLPSPEITFLEVVPSQSLMKNVTLDPASGIVPCNKVLTLKVRDDERYQIEIRVGLRANAGGYAIVVGPRFRIGPNWQPFTTDRVSDSMRGLEKAIDRFRENIQNGRRKTSEIQSKISENRSRAASADPGERFSLLAQAKGLETRLGTVQRSIDRAEKSIPETQSDIELMKRIAALGNQLRLDSELRVRVGVKTYNGEFDLVRTDDTQTHSSDTP